jgi:hypothetical protein
MLDGPKKKPVNEISRQRHLQKAAELAREAPVTKASLQPPKWAAVKGIEDENKTYSGKNVYVRFLAHRTYRSTPLLFPRLRAF